MPMQTNGMSQEPDGVAGQPVTADEADDPSGFVSPQDFYREVTQREDIRRILAALAK